MAEILKYEQVDISYNGVKVIKDVSFTVDEGEILGIVGESGSGKSTLIKAAMGLLGNTGLVTRGDIWYKGKNLPDLSAGEIRKLNGPELGMIFQYAGSSFCPIRTVGSQLYESMTEHESVSKAEFRRRASELLEKIGFENAQRLVRRTFGTSIVLVTHNIGVIGAMADKVLVMKDGEMVEYGETQQVLNDPKEAYTRTLMSAVPRLRRD